MADITACYGENCPKKESCYRFTCDKNPWRQSYFMNVPYEEKEQNKCEYYWKIEVEQK